MSRNPARIPAVCWIVVIGLALAAGSYAAVLQLDMSTEAGTYAGNVSPGHATGDVPMPLITWNGIGTGGGSAWQGGLEWGDGTAAAGIEYQLGVGFNSSWPDSWNLGGDYDLSWASPAPPGNFYDTALMEDLLYQSGGIGIRIRGLQPGRYKVYVMNAIYEDPARVWTVGVGANPGVSQFGDAVQVGPRGGLTVWSAAPGATSNYYMKEVTLASGDYLGIIATGASSPQLSGIQIVIPIPEPAAGLLLAAAAGLLPLRRATKR